jgi:hypothetical protein
MSEEHHNTVKLDKQSKQFEEYNFFVAQMDLLSKLAYDNDHAIEVITSMISFEECFSCLKVWISRAVSPLKSAGGSRHNSIQTQAVLL